MAAIAADTDRAGLRRAEGSIAAAGPPRTAHEAVVEAACRLAARLDVEVIASITRDGETARLAAKYRPRQPPAVGLRPPDFGRRPHAKGDRSCRMSPGSGG
jgi:pyruvate kinase